LTGHYSNINHHQLLNNWEGSQCCWGPKSTILLEPRSSNYWHTYVVSPSWGCTSEPSPAGGPASPAPCQPWSGCLPPGGRRFILKYVTMSTASDHHHHIFLFSDIGGRRSISRSFTLSADSEHYHQVSNTTISFFFRPLLFKQVIPGRLTLGRGRRLA